jgi:hypothetical protein
LHVAGKAQLIRRLIWPKQASMFAVVGGAIGLTGDLVSFFTELLTPPLLAGVFFVIATVAAVLCWRKASGVNTADKEALEAVVECPTCDAMRFGLFAALTFAMFMLVGQGQTVTETVGERLGLIQRDVAVISGNVQALTDMTQSQRIRSNPRTAEDFFANAWIYANIQRDQTKSHEAMRALYERFGPRKLDAAELYFASGRDVRARNELLADMQRLAAQHNDASLLVVAARNSPDPQQSRSLQQQARSMDPDMPFVWWDIQAMTTRMGGTRTDPASQTAMLREQVDGLKAFIARIGNHPGGRYFYLPQYQPDHEMLARQNLTSMENTLQTYERLQRSRAP